MDAAIRESFDDLRSEERERENRAFYHLMEATEAPVEWAYVVWDELVATLRHRSNRQRAIAAQLLCNLARSDPRERMLTDFPALLEVTRDERFVTARHCLQALWKVAAAGEKQRGLLIQGLAARFGECASEKNCTLIRYDIVAALRRAYDETGDEALRTTALELIRSEEDAKYRKKYTTLWREPGRSSR